MVLFTLSTLAATPDVLKFAYRSKTFKEHNFNSVKWVKLLSQLHMHDTDRFFSEMKHLSILDMYVTKNMLY